MASHAPGPEVWGRPHPTGEKPPSKDAVWDGEMWVNAKNGRVWFPLPPAGPVREALAGLRAIAEPTGTEQALILLLEWKLPFLPE